MFRRLLAGPFLHRGRLSLTLCYTDLMFGIYIEKASEWHVVWARRADGVYRARRFFPVA